MLGNLARMCVLAGLICGLCSPAIALTTVTNAVADASANAATNAAANAATGVSVTGIQMQQAIDGLQLAQTDLSLSPDAGQVLDEPVTEAVQLPVVTASFPPTRIALLLPSRSTSLMQVADAVRSGFMAAYQYEPGNIVVNLVETGDAAADVLSGYQSAAANNDIVVGPLTRSGATEIILNHAVTKPTVALAQPDGEAGAIPSNMLLMGLSVEDEARQAATWAATGKSGVKGAKAFAISTSVSWQRRAASAFVTKWRALGMQPDTIELPTGSGFINANGMLQLRKRIQEEKPTVLFLALDATQAIQLRMAIGNSVPMVGTSQLNPVALDDWPTANRLNELEGVLLVDMPWQLQADHAAVMAYPHLPPMADQRRSPDIERLYALGIDAYRVAHNIALKQTDFQLDGVTGKLAVRFGNGPAYFDRVMQTAVYRDGMVQPLQSP